MIAVFAAMDWELAGFKRRLVNIESERVDGYLVRRGSFSSKPVLLCQTGLRRRAEKAVHAVLERGRPWFVLSTGFGGALDPKLSTGDLVLCESVRTTSREPAIRSDGDLLNAAQVSAEAMDGLPVHRGRSLTTERLAGEPPEKLTLRQSWEADVVEMESYWVGLASAEMGLPFLAARVVLDEQTDTLPELTGLVDADGSVRSYRALTYAIRHPSRVLLLMRVALSQRRALRSLTRFLESFIGAFETSSVARPASA